MTNPADKYFLLKCDGGSSLPRNIGGSSYTGGGLGKYSGGGSSGRRSPEEEERIRQLLLSNIQPDGGSPSRPNFGGGYSGVGSNSYSSSSSGSSIYFIGIIILIILGLVLNFIFHLELWMIAVILIISLVVIWVIAKILD